MSSVRVCVARSKRVIVSPRIVQSSRRHRVVTCAAIVIRLHRRRVAARSNEDNARARWTVTKMARRALAVAPLESTRASRTAAPASARAMRAPTFRNVVSKRRFERSGSYFLIWVNSGRRDWRDFRKGGRHPDAKGPFYARIRAFANAREW